MSTPLLVAHDVAEVPRLWPDGRKRELAAIVERVAQGSQAGLEVVALVSGIEVVPAPENHRLYFQRAEHATPDLSRGRARVQSGVRLFGLAPAPADELLVRAGVAGPDPKPLATLPEARLLAFGVPAPLVRAVRGAPSLEALHRLRLPDPVMARLRTFCVAVAPAVVNFVPEVLKYEVADLATLEQYYLGDIKRLLLNLEAQQRELVDLSPRGPILVKGVAGSGKTTVAIYRARRLLMASPLTQPRVLVLSYTRALTQAANELLHDLCERDVPELMVSTVHAWCYGYLESRGKPPRVVEERKRQRESALARALVAARARSDSKILARPNEFWLDEFSEVIKGRCGGQWNQYRSVERVGRGGGLTEQGKEVVWSVFDAYQANLRQMRRLDWEDVVMQALALLENDSTFAPYDYVFLDEAQDLPLVVLRLVARLSRDPSGLFLMADGRQSIYQKGFRWKDVGLEIRGRVHTLRRNFRSTVEIAAAADSLRASAVDASEDEQVEPPVRHGPRPKLVGCPNVSSECAFVVGRVGELLQSNAASPCNIGILARHTRLLRQLDGALNAQGVPTRMHKEGELVLGDPTVKLLTLHSAKGLEFPIVVVVGVDHGTIPEELAFDDLGELEAHLTRERRLLYVGMTRAMQDLTVVYDSSRPSPFITQLDPALFEVRKAAQPAPPPPLRATTPVRPVHTSKPAAPSAHPGATLVALLDQVGVEYVDKRPAKGALWIVESDPAADLVRQLKERGVKLLYKKEGARSTAYRAAWWTTDKR